MLADQSQRKAALETHRSFIVHAPAGSGKTELLIQRYLTLLAESNTPESVLAITFTRKAAAEMKSRVLEALLSASRQMEAPNEPHYKTRWILAKKLYDWQLKQGWNLLAQPHRLQIQTIDAFYAKLIRKAPLMVELHPEVKITDNGEPLYQEAVQRLLSQLENNSDLGQALVRLARHLNNDFVQIERLLIHLLYHRDQWLFLLKEGSSKLEKLRDILEESLAHLYQEACQNAAKAFSITTTANEHHLLSSLLDFCRNTRGLPSLHTLPDEQFWLSAAELLLTQEEQWRKKPTKTQGFPASTHAQSIEEKKYYEQMKNEYHSLLNALRTHEPLRLALLAIKRLPSLHYTESQWLLLKSLFHILNALVTFLHFVFQQYNQIDYIELGLRAFTLLGEEAPTELLLKLDYQIQHILIDEFQDTSFQQLRFFSRLTEGWQPKDGRTLFLVGDPMQSIYRFRKAEARLFNMVKQQGLGSCKLETLTLSTNFRSTDALIKWTNNHFLKMEANIPSLNNTTRAFAPSTPSAHSAANDDSDVQLHWFPTIQQEIEKITELVQKYSKQLATRPLPSEGTIPQIAILGRTRQSLIPIIRSLQAANIAYQAIEIDSLADQPVIQDLLALTRALVHLADDIAWLALLRAPWCGATLYDLHEIMQACKNTNPQRLIWEQLQHIHELPLSTAAQYRLNRIKETLQPIMASYGRASLQHRIHQAWLNLGGPAIYSNLSNLEVITNNFFQCINSLQAAEIQLDYRALEQHLKHSYINTEQPAAVVVMTIHKAKGLEFETVILPNLHKNTRTEPSSLILFEEHPDPHLNQLLIAPIKSSESAIQEDLYRYLRENINYQNHLELLRLFYVGCTRAKYHLHLTGTLEEKEGVALAPNTGSFLHWLWPTLDHHQKKLVQPNPTSPHYIPAPTTEASSTRWLRRMTANSDYPRTQ